jgi:1-phosphofructokinase family hexose kinase
MILTVTPNPSLDLLYQADNLVWDDANRIPEPTRRPGGQGVNLARTAIELGADATAIALLGGSTGDEVEAILAHEGTPAILVRTSQPTRVFVGIREHASQRSLLLNSPGPERSRTDADRILAALEQAMATRPPSWVACCGSLPPGFDADFYAEAGRLARRAGCRFVTDCDGPALKAAAARADLLVPNHHEAGRLLERNAGDVDAAAAAALDIANEFGVPLVAITLGEKGAVLSDRTTTWHASPPHARGSTVGAGDAFLAGLLIELEAGRSPEAALRTAVTVGTAAVGTLGGAMIDVSRISEIADTTTLRQV